MPIYRTEGIVLRSYPFRDTSKVVVLYSPKFGKLGLVAKGARRPKSIFVGSLEPITYIKVTLYHRENRELHTLSQAEVVEPFRRIKEDIGLLGYASAACELVLRLTPPESPNPPLFRALSEVLREMGRTGKGEVLLWWFELRAAEALGYRPELGRCAFCGGPLEGASFGFRAEAGGVLCPRCASDGDFPLSPGAVRLLLRLQKLTAARAAMLSTSGSTGEQARGALRALLSYHTERKGLRALDFLHKVKPSLEGGHI